MKLNFLSLDFKVLMLLVGFLLIDFNCQSQAIVNTSKIRGNLKIDSTWNPIAYLSHIKSFNSMHTISNDMIITQTTIDSLGNFEFDTNFLSESDNLYRVHLSKKDNPPATLIIGGTEENHVFLIANNKSNIFITNSGENRLFNTDSIKGYKPNQYLYIIDEISNAIDSINFKSLKIKREFIKEGINENLRVIADTCTNSLVSLYALHKSQFFNNYSKNQTFYNNYLDKWKNEKSIYFQDFKNQLPAFKSNNYKFILIGIVCFILGFFINFFTKKKGISKKRMHSLSIQERKILRLMILGKSNKEISEECNIGVSTVKSHVSKIYSKLNIKSRKDVMKIDLELYNL